MTRPTVMIVDDQPDICTIVQFALESDGYPCLPFCNAREALAHLCEPASHQPQLIFLDYMMPGYDGRAFLQVLEQQGIRHRYFILLFSATSGLERLKEELGCDAVLSKPFSLAELTRSLHHAEASLKERMSLLSANVSYGT